MSYMQQQIDGNAPIHRNSTTINDNLMYDTDNHPLSYSIPSNSF